MKKFLDHVPFCIAFGGTLGMAVSGWFKYQGGAGEAFFEAAVAWLLLALMVGVAEWQSRVISWLAADQRRKRESPC